MRILKVWDCEYPWDVRAEKVCRSLTAMGHDVHMVARNRDRRPLVEELEECTVHRMRPWRVAGQRLDGLLQFPAFFSPRWINLTRETAEREQVSGILVRDLPLAPTAINVGARLGLPVVLDMAEHYAAMMRDLWDTDSTRLGDSLVRNPAIVERVERWVLENVDHTMVVVEESRDRLVRNGVDPERISVVSNTPPLDRVARFDEIRRTSGERADDADVLRLAYLGLMEEARGVRLVIDAAAQAISEGIPVRLDLIGDGRALSDFRQLAADHGMSEDVARFYGFLPYEEALAIVSRADVGLIPHHASESWESTIPNKLFDYMSLALPVLSSDVGSVTRILEATGAGRTFRDRDHHDLARVLRALYEDELRAEMGRRGREAVGARYNWEQDAAVMADVVDRFFGSPTLVPH